MQWKYKRSHTHKKFRVQHSAGKTMATAFLELMPHKTTITGDTYASTMLALLENITQKRLESCRLVLLLHDNAPAHTSHTSGAAIRKCGFVELNHPPYSPDLAPSLLSLQNLKKILRERRFPNHNAVKEVLTCNRVLWHPICFIFLGVFDYRRRSGLSVLQSTGTTLKNNEMSFINGVNFHDQVDNLLNAPRISKKNTKFQVNSQIHCHNMGNIIGYPSLTTTQSCMMEAVS